MQARARNTPFPRSLVLLLLLAAACASGKKAQEGPTDAGPDSDAEALSQFGDPCTDGNQCESGICLDVEEDQSGWCSASCDEGCPSSYACSEDQQVCIPATEFLCLSCQSDEDCGGQGNRCIEYSSGSFCAADCASAAASCPQGFSCEDVSVDASSLGMLCVSDSELCCIDADGDFRGQGDDCRATDCDDSDPDIYDDASEVCDGKDNDCAGGTDLDISDCGDADCRLTSIGYVQRADETCIDAACMPQPEVLCGLYTCSQGGESGDQCATSCDGEDDAKCADPAHCESSSCTADLADGGVCDEASDCGSGHCQNGFCCGFADCCQVASDCPSFGSFDPVCEDPRTCQGARGAAVCTSDNTCATTGVEQDDSACTAQTEANDCGFFLPVFCNGQLDQQTPTCPTTCSSNADCDANAFCDDVTDTCVEDVVDGDSCAADSQCQSGHCQNGFCCADGDCCESASDCPAGYSSAPSCTVASACQGQRDLAQCVNSECSTLNNAPDDTACSPSTLSDTCGPYPSVNCSGAIDQQEPSCATSCTGNSQCDANAYCNAQGQCENDEPNGSACTGDSQCTSGHCENGFCCATGDCCSDSDDCNHLDVAADCDSQSDCQGTRVDGVCGGNFQCSTTQVDDDSACAGLQSNDCDLFPSVSCTASPTQSSNQAGLCASSCTTDNDCDVSAHCDNGDCVPDAGQGGFCNQQSDCTSGFVCVDNVCCGSTCGGACEACDLSGSVGTCSQVGNGQDPDLECAGVDCAGFYFGWEGNTCFEKADVSAAGATCGGDGACGSTSEECSAQTLRGPAQTVCNSTCQTPDLSTCDGTTGGACTNLDLGTETCGTGVCQVTVDQCNNGSPQACVPNSGASTAETCDGLDNDCNGSVDDGMPGDILEPNNSCQNHFPLSDLPEGFTAILDDMTIYTAGDDDWYRIRTPEDFTTCTAGVNETYLFEVFMTPPAGQDYDLEVCYNSFTDGSCTLTCEFGPSINGGDSSEIITHLWDGPCGGGTNDGRNYFIRVFPFLSANSCEPYSLEMTFLKTN